MTAMRRLTSGRDPCLPRDPQLAQRRERDALMQHLEAVAADLGEQRAIDRRHDESRALALAIGLGQLRVRLLVVALRTRRLERHQSLECLAAFEREDVFGGEPELREVL